MNDSIYQLGAVAILFLVGIREFFAYLKSKKGNGVDTILSQAILSELQKMNNNHLDSIKEAIENGNNKMTSAFARHTESGHSDSMQIVQLLGEIKGHLSK